MCHKFTITFYLRGKFSGQICHQVQGCLIITNRKLLLEGASSCLSKWSRSCRPAMGSPGVSGARLLPAAAFPHRCPLSLPLSRLAGHPSLFSLPPPAPDAALWLGVSSVSTPLPPPGRDWVQLQSRSALGEVPRGVAMCVQSRDDGAGRSGRPRSTLPPRKSPEETAAPPLTN